MAKAIQTHRQIAVGTPLGDDVLLLRSFTFREQLGRPFEMTLDMVSDTSDIAFANIVGQNVTVRIQKPMDDQTRYLNGIVREFVQMPGSGRTTQYQATVVPWLWLLTRTSDCRIFQDKTVPDIIKEVFRAHGLTDFEDRLSGSYRTWEYCVQYRETDFNFVSRLMEQEGIYYFFTHENGKHKMALVDTKSSHEPFAGYEQIVYRPPNVQFREKEYIHEVSIAQAVQPGTYAHTDYDFKSPKKDLQTKSLIQRPNAQGDFELFDYPGVFVEYGEGETYSRLRIEELHTEFEVARCKTNARGIATGCKFTLADHPRGDLNKDYLIVDSTMTARTDEFDSAPGATTGTTFQCGFSCIDLQNQFRTARTTRKPMIRGPQTAVVAGPSGEEIHTDKYGRAKVQFHWDRYSKADENSSCWIRVSQSVAGKKWGQLFLPRIGQEVIVEFLEGDPDRPIITGRVYNGVTMPPYDLPANKTISTMKSNSSKGGAGFNEIRFEDKKGEEQIFVHGEKNLDIRIKNDRFEWIGNNRHLIVKKDQLAHVENNRHEFVDADHMEEIGKDRHLKVKGKEAKEVVGSQSLKVTGDVAEEFGGNHSEKAAMAYYLKAGTTIVIEDGAGITLKCGSNSVVIDPSGVTITGTMVTIAGSAMTKINSGPGSPAGSGSPCSLVPPAAPTKAEEADKADPGEVEDVKARQRQTKTGKYGSTQVKPYKPPESEEEAAQKPHWIQIHLVDDKDKPIPGQKYEIKLPDGSTVAAGTLDGNGQARVDGIADPGQCQITFPDLDKDKWHRA